MTPDGFVQTIKVAEVGHVALDCCSVPADFNDCRVQRLLAAARNEDVVYAFLNKPLGSGQTYTGRGSSDDGDFPSEFI